MSSKHPNTIRSGLRSVIDRTNEGSLKYAKDEKDAHRRCLFLAATAAAAQPAGRFETHDLGSFKLHVYYTDDALGDVSYIVEGEDALVTLEQPLFRENVAEFDAYLSALGKPVQTRIADYHVGGTGDQDVVMAEGMPEYTKGEVYTGMMTGFEQAFGEALAPAPTGRTSEAAFGSTHTWAGVTFEFRPGRRPTSPVQAF